MKHLKKYSHYINEGKTFRSALKTAYTIGDVIKSFGDVFKLNFGKIKQRIKNLPIGYKAVDIIDFIEDLKSEYGSIKNLNAKEKVLNNYPDDTVITFNHRFIPKEEDYVSLFFRKEYYDRYNRDLLSDVREIKNADKDKNDVFSFLEDLLDYPDDAKTLNVGQIKEYDK